MKLGHLARAEGVGAAGVVASAAVVAAAVVVAAVEAGVIAATVEIVVAASGAGNCFQQS
jgi:hypothetical protein